MSRTAEEWGRIAVSLPGWRWMPGMLDTEGDRWGGVTLHDGAREVLRAVAAPKQYAYEWRDRLPDPDDPATAGCLLALAGAPHRLLPTVEAWISGAPVEGITSLGRAVIADVRDQWGRWPGGEG